MVPNPGASEPDTFNFKRVQKVEPGERARLRWPCLQATESVRLDIATERSAPATESNVVARA